ncbi:MAG: STAS domain-containing protein [Pyrinomonadaceae bacterium]
MLKVHAKNLGNVAVLSLQGRIVNGDTEILHTAVDDMTDVSAVILDLARVTTVDARGLGVMLELREQAEAKGIRFELMNLTQMVGKVLEISHLDTVFKISSGVEVFPTVARSRRAPVAALASCA